MGHSNISSSSESLLVLPNRWKSLNSSSHDDEVKVFGTQHSTFTIMETGFCCGSAGKESTCNVGDLSLILGWQDPWKRERLPTPVFWPGESHGQRSPYIPWVTKSQTQLSDFLFNLLKASLEILNH